MKKVFLICSVIGLMLAMTAGWRIDESEVIGVWQLTADTLKMAKRNGYVPDTNISHTIELRADHTVSFSSVIERLGKAETIIGEGTWKLERTDSSQLALILGKHSMTLEFTQNNSGQLILWGYWGDPDQWDFIQYEKAVPGSRPPGLAVHK